MSAKAVSYKIGMIKPNETNLWVIYFREKLVVFNVLPIAWLEDCTMSSPAMKSCNRTL